MFLSNKYVSTCCFAPIQLRQKKIKNSREKIKIWACCKCRKRDIDIIEKSKVESQETELDLSEDS